MPSDKCNLITAKATGLIFSLFDVASAGHVPFGNTGVATLLRLCELPSLRVLQAFNN